MRVGPLLIALPAFALVQSFVRVSSAAEKNGEPPCREMGDAGVPAKGRARYALVIGNDAYKPGMRRLTNSGRDAEVVAKELAVRGFRVTLCKNLIKTKLEQAITDYKNKLPRENPEERVISLFYFTGHGSRSGEDAVVYGIEPQAGETYAQQAVKLPDIILGLDPERLKLHASILIFDACRDGSAKSEQPPPPAEIRKSSMPAAEAPAGTYIVFSTAPNHTASDVSSADGNHSPFAHSFKKALMKSEWVQADIDTFFRYVRAGVHEDTQHGQTVWTSHSLVHGTIRLKEPSEQTSQAEAPKAAQAPKEHGA